MNSNDTETGLWRPRLGRAMCRKMLLRFAYGLFYGQSFWTGRAGPCAQVDGRQLIPAGSEREVEIRACTIQVGRPQSFLEALRCSCLLLRLNVSPRLS